MPRNRKAICISFPTPEEADEAKRKANQGNRGGLSKVVQRHLKQLPDLEK